MPSPMRRNPEDPLTAIESQLLEDVRSLSLERDELVRVMRLIKHGLVRGHIKAKPIIDFAPNIETCEMTSLLDIVDLVLDKYKP